MNPKYSERDLKRFWSRVQKSSDPNGCWIWKGRLNLWGYGEFHLDGKDRRAHRVSYFFANGEFPDEVLVLHNCPSGDNPACVNPAHLWLGTNLDNMRDMYEKGRANNLGGEKSRHHSLTLQQVKHIRSRHLNEDISHQQLADEVGVTKVQIGSILRNKSWIDPEYQPKPVRTGNHKLSDDKREQLIAEWNSTKPKTEIAMKYGISVEHASRVVRQSKTAK